ncbi:MULTISPECIES: endolytic transglycosylase MltG [Flavobacterium]|uniref:Endolytic murein transglycosylase n=1 Tax=Flavobacterium lindanitolerans TaxID=428988 RepID=A0A497V2F6_9FLAO|nr:MULTISPECIES: endolytic transglycosylase MltG [Flavobacterium]PZQ92239.1 MAG: endolytic transglycosylase MltG [Flavobacterium johnsoniae]KQS47261.1 aminodeoxychorismate lyase [Flavobacterium sp. Leaf359]MBL7869634.1 endolytic transglycosylase MltG [Flavobacterium lindanitolerans]MDQ7962223.1 endolytic transglycosylase MltG [Flavobacterium lindanitolerans]OJX52227.1 MAG: aminodeoxychorismate lyase [Flavobacterium sp. 38-13]
MKIKKIVAIFSVLLVLALSVYGYMLYRKIFSANTNFSEKEVYVYIPTDANYETAEKIVAPYVENLDNFRMVAEKKSYITNVKPGKFLLKKGMNNNDIINSLRISLPVKLAFNNQERLEDFAGRIGSQIEADSTSLMKAFTDKAFLDENGFTEENVLSMFIPNSYEFFWNTSAEKFRDRMAKEYRAFWNDERKAKAEAQNLTPLEVSTLASIVHKETVKTDERPRVAGVYLNRLKSGIKLEADPTVIYAVKKEANDFNRVIKRVLYKDLETVSPYNTYRNFGLPPGPIAMPDVSAIDAVLNPEKHNYIYFCASVTNFGYHEFAVTPAQHEVNRQKYVAWVNKQGIKR